MKLHFYRSLDNDAGGDLGNQEQTKPDFSALSSVDFLATASEAEQQKLDQSAEEKQKVIDAAAASNQPEGLEVPDDIKVTEEEKLKVENALKEEAEKTGKTVEELKAQQEADAKAKELAEKEVFVINEEGDKSSENTNVENDNWLGLAKEVGFEIAEDTFEAYKKGFEEHANKRFEEGRKITFEEFKKGKSADAQFVIDALETGATIEDITAPAREIDNLLALSSAEIVRKDLELQQNWTPEMVETEMERLVESGLLEHEAQKLKSFLTTQKSKINTEWVEKINTYKSKELEQKTTERVQRAEMVKKSLEDTKAFMDAPLTPKVVEYISEKFKSGKYDEMLNNPAKLSQFLLYAEFGERAEKNLRQKSFEQGRETVTKKLHNVPPVQQGGLSKTAGTQQTGKEGGYGNWDLLEQALKG